MALRWGCLGPGQIASDFFLAIRENLPATEHEFAAVASKDLTRAEKFAERFKFIKAYGSYDEVALDPDVDVVYIATLFPTHAELSVKMLEAGKHVLCEKPMAINSNQASKVFEAARKNKRFFMEAMWTMFNPSIAHVRKEIEAGTLGEIRLVQGTICVNVIDWDRFNDPSLGGGSVLDIGIYLAALVTMVFDEMPEIIQAVGHLADVAGKGDVDTRGCFVLRYRSGALASLMYAADADAGDNNEACIIGSKGMIKVKSPMWASECVITPTGTHEFPIKQGDYNLWNSGGLHYEAAAVRESILKGQLESETCPMAHSERCLAIVDEVRRQIGMRYPEFE